MKTFIERYNNGEYREVWEELFLLDDGVRDPSILPDALSVVNETMTRVQQNIVQIYNRLVEIGYEFEMMEGIDKPIIPPAPYIKEQIREIESIVGIIPLSLKAWYEMVGTVSFLGRHPKWDTGIYYDPLFVSPIETALMEYDEWRILLEKYGEEKIGPYCISIAPDYYHKANISGGEPYKMAIPNAAIDAKLLNERHDTTFVEYLRICFTWGGFPGLENSSNNLPEVLDYLTKDLLPI